MCHVYQRQVGDAYPLGALTQTQRDLAQDFVDLGLLFKRKAKSTRFYPTSIAVNLIFGSSPAGGGGGVGQRQPQPAGALAVRGRGRDGERERERENEREKEIQKHTQRETGRKIEKRDRNRGRAGQGERGGERQTDREGE